MTGGRQHGLYRLVIMVSGARFPTQFARRIAGLETG